MVDQCVLSFGIVCIIVLAKDRLLHVRPYAINPQQPICASCYLANHKPIYTWARGLPPIQASAHITIHPQALQSPKFASTPSLYQYSSPHSPKSHAHHSILLSAIRAIPLTPPSGPRETRTDISPRFSQNRDYCKLCSVRNCMNDLIVNVALEALYIHEEGGM